MFHQAKNFVISGGQFTIAESNHDAVSTILWPHVAAGAVFDSAERYPAGKCHPQTRQMVIDQMTTWIKEANPPQRILWMYGAAGSGKSALMQSLCELLRDLHPELKGGSFFFAKRHLVRGYADKLFVTLAYQLAIQFPAVRAAINDALTQDPSLPTKSMDIQLRSLIIDPLLRCQRSPSTIMPTLFIDGLDECESDRTQRQVITLISKSIIEHDIPIRFIIASRPEYWIRDTFEASPLHDIAYSLSLRDDIDADKDIKAYLTDGFEKIRHDNKRIMQSVELRWPPEHIVDRFVYEASGQYIYASTILKFVGNETLFNDPQEQLEILLNSGPDRAPAFTELDRLYQTVLSVYPRWEQMKRVLAGLLMGANLTAIRVLLRVPQTEITLVLDALSSLIDITPPEPLSEYAQLLSPIFGSSLDDERISFCHLSFREFLQDKARSGSYHVDVPAIHVEAINAFFAVIQRNLDENYEIEPHLLCNMGLSEYYRMMGAIVRGDASWYRNFRDLIPALNNMMERFRRFDPHRRMNYPACFMRDMRSLSTFLHHPEFERRTQHNPDAKEQDSDLSDSFLAISNEVKNTALLAGEIGIHLLSLSDGFDISRTLFVIWYMSKEIFSWVSIQDLLTIPGNTLADIVSTIRQHCHIIEVWSNSWIFMTLHNYRQEGSRSMIPVNFGKQLNQPILWPDWSNHGALINIEATMDEGWLSHKEWKNQYVSLVCDLLKSVVIHLDNNWEHIMPWPLRRKESILADFFNNCVTSDIQGMEYFENPYNLSLLEVMLDSKAWMGLFLLHLKLRTSLNSLINPVLGWFDRQLTNPEAIRLMEQHDVLLPQKLKTAMKCIFKHCFIPIFKMPYFSDLLVSTLPGEDVEKTVRLKVVKSNLLEEETAFTPSEDYFLSWVPDFLIRQDPPPLVPTSEWYTCLSAYILNNTVKGLYRENHPEFGGQEIWQSSSFRNSGNDSSFNFIFRYIQYAQTTPQNLDALRAIKYLSQQIHRQGSELMFGLASPRFISPTRELLKRYEPSVLHPDELSDFESWLRDLEESKSFELRPTLPPIYSATYFGHLFVS